MKRLIVLFLLLLLAPLHADQGKARMIKRNSGTSGGGGGGGGGTSLVAQGVHPRTGGLSSATIPTIAAKINAYYDDDPTVTYPEVAGSFPDFLAELDFNYGMSATSANARRWAHAYCLVGHILPSLTTGGGTGISPAHTATQYGQEGARLAAAISSSDFNGEDGGFPQANIPYVYDWCYNWTDATTRSNIRTAVQNFETGANCDALYASPFAADSNKTCSVMFASAVATAGDGGETWGTNHLSEWTSVMESNSTGIIGSESAVANLYKSEYGYGSCATPGLAYFSYMWQYDVLASETYRFGATTQTPTQFFDTTKYSFLPSGIYCLNYLTRPYARTNASGIEPNDLDWQLMRTQYAGVFQQDPNDAADLPVSVFAGIWNSVETAPARLAMWYQRNRLTRRAPSGEIIGRAWVYRFTMEDPTITASSPSTLNVPLSARMGDGSYYFRSAWPSDSSGTEGYWAIKITLPAFSVPGDGREAMNMSGAIEVHRKGAQLIWRGAGAHVPIVHGGANTLYFFNTGRTTDWDGSSSGTDPWNFKIDGRPVGWANQPQASGRGADIVQGGAKDYLNNDAYIRKRFASGNVTTDYVYANRKNSYPSSGWYTTADAPAEESEVLSQYIIFRPPSANGAARIARFEVVTNTSNSWIPLIAWNPAADSISVDNSTSAGALHGLTTHGFVKSTNSHVLTASNTYNLGGLTTSGRNTLTVVHPASNTIVIGGGASESAATCSFSDGDAGWDDSSTPNSSTSLEGVDFYGFRHPFLGNPCADPDQKMSFGQYFATVSPTSVPNGTRTNFLLFYETDDNGSTAASVTELTSLTNVEGFQWRDSDMNGIAVFGANGADQSTGGFTVPTAGTYTLTMTNISTSTISLAFGGGCATFTNLADADTSSPWNVDTASKSITGTLVTTGSNCAVSW